MEIDGISDEQQEWFLQIYVTECIRTKCRPSWDGFREFLEQQ